MNKRPLRKLAGLVVLYILIFFVIIVIQFKNETIINETFGPFHIILSETKDEDNNLVLKNEFQITAGELTFFADSQYTARIIIGDNEKNLTLNTWQKKSDSDFVLFFDNDVYVEFEAPENTAIPLIIHASVPAASEKVIIPYKLTTTANIEVVDDSSLLLTGREQLFKINAAQIDGSTIALTKNSPSFSIAEYVEETQFTFDTIVEHELAQIAAYNTSKSRIQKSIIELFPANPDETSLSENAVIAWTAEMAAQNKYAEALNNLASYARSSGRTYLSTPYFNTLSASNKTLSFNLSTFNNDIKNSQGKRSLALFSNDNFLEKCVIVPRDTLQNLLTAAKSIIENQPETVSSKNAASLMAVYNRLKKYKIKAADILEPILDSLIKIIEACIDLDENDNLVVLNGTNQMDFMDRIKTGFAMMETGSYINNDIAQAAGRLLINSTVQSAEQLSLETVAALYPMFVPENQFYPHIELLSDDRDGIVWAWTIASKMSYEKDENGIIVIKATFPQNEVHHMIIRGIKKFNAIDIYGIAYRTDPRFESYNSSGYVFESDTESLLLKYRQRSADEEIKLYYK